jgi:uncharacterized protein (TIGR03437 family)
MIYAEVQRAIAFMSFRNITLLSILAILAAIPGFSAISLNNSNLATATVGVAYSATLTAVGGNAPYTFALATGVLPGGISVSTVNGQGVISGTPTAAGTFNFALKVTDNTNANVDVPLVLIVNNNGGVQILVSSLPQGQIGTGYFTNLAATGGTAPYVWDLVPGNGFLPNGLSLASSGVILGSPTVAGTFNFVLRVTDANGAGSSASASFSLTVTSNVLNISTTALPGGNVGAFYSQALAVSGGTQPYSISLSNGSLPSGLTLSSAGVISGTPTTVGTSNFTVQVVDGLGANFQRALSISVAAAQFSFNQTPLPTGQVGTAYSATVSAVGGTLPYTYSLVGGTLPTGIAFANGTLSGTPQVSGAFPLTIRATDNTTAFVNGNFTLVINSNSLFLSGAALPNAALNQTYTATITATGGQPGYGFSLIGGALPSGLNLLSNGAIQGVPSVTGNFQFTVRVTDSLGSVAQGSYSISVSTNNLTFLTGALSNGVLNQAYNTTLNASGGSGGYTFSIIGGGLPPGLSLSSAGNITGTPTATGSYQVTFRVQDGFGNIAQATLTLTVISTSFRVTTPLLPSAQLGQAYSAAIGTEGGSAPFFFVLQGGGVPPGLNLGINGVVSGTPTVSGNYSFTVGIFDNASQSIQATIALSVNAPGLNLTSSTLPGGQVGQSYSSTLAATGGSAPYTFTNPGGNLPPGLSLSSAGVISGTPTTNGNFVFAVRIQDNNNASATFNLAISIGGASFTFNSQALPNGGIGVSYLTTLSASGGVTPYQFALNSGSLPNGLSLSTSGVISGIPTSNGTFTFSIRATDNQAISAIASFTIQVSGTGALNITTVSFPTAQLNQPYSASVGVAGGVAPYQYSINGGALPPGLTLLSNGSITGTPTIVGNYGFLLRVVDSQGSATQSSLSINVGNSGLSITTTSLPSIQIGQFFTTQLNAIGGFSPYTWTVVSGALPVGVTLSTSGILSGLPTSGGGQVIIQVADASSATAQRSFTIQTGVTGLTILTNQLPVALLNQQYSFQLQAAGGSAPYTFTLLSGTLPTGITLSSNGLLSGVATSVSIASLTFRATDVTNATTQATLTLSVSQSAFSFTNATVPNATQSQNYTFPFTVTGGVTPYTFTVSSGNLPAGISLSGAGVLSGITTQVGNFSFTVRVQDSFGITAFQTYVLTVVGSSFQITTTTIPSGRVGRPYLQSLQTIGGFAPIRFELLTSGNSGFPPPGVTLSADGVLSGTPQAAGTFAFTVRALDSQNTVAVINYSLVVAPPAPVINTSTFPAGTVGQSYSQAVQVTGGTPPFTLTLFTGSLPPGLNFSAQGLISGSPTAAGNYTFTVRASDTGQQTVDATFTIVINAPANPLTVSAVAPPPALLHHPFNFQFSATGGVEPYSWLVLNGPLPNGLRLSQSGVLSGFFLAPGVYRFTARVSDSLGAAAETSLAITVGPAQRLTSGRVGAPYTGQAPPPIVGRPPYAYTFNANALGELPAGLTLNTDGSITGTPQHAGDATFGVVIRDASGFSSNVPVSIFIAPASGFSISNLSLPGGAVGAAYNQTPGTNGGQGPFSWSIVSGRLPVGLSLNASSGQITGIPTQLGSNFFVLRASDASGSAATASLVIHVGSNTAPIVSTITSAASYASNGVAPGEILTIFGGGMGPLTLVPFSLVNGALPTTVSNTSVLFDGVAAPVLYSQTGQVSVIAPFGLSDRPATRVVVEYLGGQSPPVLMPVVASKPGLFTVDSSGQGPGAILNQNGSVNTSSNRAGRESVVVLYLTGGGAMTPAGVDGRVATQLSSLNLPVTVSVNGLPATVLYAGNAPGLVEGVVQMNVRLPLGTSSGQNAISVLVGPNPTITNVTVWVE